MDQKVQAKIEAKIEKMVKKQLEAILKEQAELADADQVDVSIDNAPSTDTTVDTASEPETPVEEPAVEDSLDVPTDFPEDGVLTVTKAMVTMGLTSAIRDMSDDLAGSYPELEDLAMDIQLRLIEALSTPEAIDKAANAIAKLVKFGRENLISDTKD